MKLSDKVAVKVKTIEDACNEAPGWTIGVM